MAPLVSTKFVLGLVACQVSYRVGPSSDLDTGSCTRAREVMMFCTIKSKPLALPWGRTPRLSSGVRVSTHVCQRMSECLVLGFPSISVTLVVVGVGPLSGKGPRIIVFADASVLPRITSLKCVLTQEHLDAICANVPPRPKKPFPSITSINLFLHKNTLMLFVLNILSPRKSILNCQALDATMHEKTRLDRAPAPSEYNVEHVNALIAHAFLMDLNAFIRTADPRKVRIVERPRAENEGPIVTVAKHRTVTLLPTSMARSSGELSASVEREFVGDASVGDGGDQGFDSAVGQAPQRSKKKRVVYDSEGLPVAPHPPKRLRTDYGTAGGSVTGGKSLSALNRLLQDSRLTVEQGVPALPTLPFITSSVTASPLEEGGDRTDSVTGPSLRTIGPSVRFVVLSDSSHHSGANSTGPEVDSLVRSTAPIMTEAITVATTVAIPADISKDKGAPHPSVFGSSGSSEKTDRTLSLFTGRSGSGFDAGHSVRSGECRMRLRGNFRFLSGLVDQGF
ncbi:hypothetical protein Tco_0532394 [Tanacetum coccineum]